MKTHTAFWPLNCVVYVDEAPTVTPTGIHWLPRAIFSFALLVQDPSYTEDYVTYRDRIVPSWIHPVDCDILSV